MRVWAALVGSSVLALSSAAYAQTTSDQAQAPARLETPTGSAETSPSTAASDDTRNAADIVVTANRRTERLQEVPIAVTVVDGAQLTRQNVNTIEDLSRTAPALNLAGPPGFGAVSIRGIGNLGFSRTSESSVGVVVDGVSLANTSNTSPQLLDLARVEVLEGPQGTLFGKNASGGVINITTNAPDPSKVEVIAHADIGTRNNYIARGAFNLPVASNAALRFSGAYSQDPQVQHNLNDDSWLRREGKSGRARFLWEPTDRITINLSGDYSDTDYNGGAPWVVYSSTPNSLLSRRLAACGVTVGENNQEGCVDGGNNVSARAYGFSGQIDMAFGGATLTSISAYRSALSKTYRSDTDSTPVNRLVQSLDINTRNFSQELRLTSPSHGIIQYVAGLYYFDSAVDGATQQVGSILADLPLINACPLPAAALCALPLGQIQSSSSNTTSYAAFGQATVNVTSALRFILGGRLGRENVYARANTVQAPGTLAPIFMGPSLGVKTTDSYFSYRAGVQYDLTRDFMAYATYTRGYKGPAINDQATTATTPLLVEPEIPKSAEVGIKSTFAGGRAALNVSGFYTKVTNFQAQYYDPALAAYIYGNAPSLTTKGATVNLFGNPFRGLTANLGVSYIDAKYGAGYLVVTPTNAIVDAEDNQLVGAQKWRVTASGEYATRITDSIDGFVQADVVYGSRGYSDAANTPILSIAGKTIVGGRVGFRLDDGRFGVSAFARNLFDTFRPAARFPTPVSAQQLDPAAFSQFVGPEARRVIGLSLDAKF